MGSRNLVSPAWWIKMVENGELSRTTQFSDYNLTNSFQHCWQGQSQKERFSQLGANGFLPSKTKGAYLRQRDSISRLTASHSSPTLESVDSGPRVFKDRRVRRPA